MEKLSIKEKAKLYDEAIEKLHEIITMDNKPVNPKEIGKYLFPELKESEDERIRKKIIQLVNDAMATNAPYKKEMLAWLEKQGEHANFRNKIQIGDKVTRNEDGVLVNLSQLNRVAKKDEKQGEQKIVEFKPSFRVGDVIKPKDPVLGEQRIIKGIYPKFGYDTNNGILDFEFEDNWELVEEHKKCMYSKDDYTDEDRKVLCDGCEEECEYNKKRESVSERFAFKAIPRLLEMIEPTDRAKVYVTKLADALEVEGYSTDAKIVMESLKIMNGEKVPMATMDEEPVSEEFEEALAKEWKGYVDRGAATVDALEDNTQELTFAKGFYRGAKWQKKQMMANTANAMIGLPYENKDGGYTHLIDVSRPLPVGNNKIAIILKED